MKKMLASAASYMEEYPISSNGLDYGTDIMSTRKSTPNSRLNQRKKRKYARQTPQSPKWR